MTLMDDATARDDEERQHVRAAMSRIRDNMAEQSNGARTVVALAAESGIPRQRLYEHHGDLLSEFKATVGCGPVAPNVDALQRQIAQARDHNQELATECSLAKQDPDALRGDHRTHTRSGRGKCRCFDAAQTPHQRLGAVVGRGRGSGVRKVRVSSGLPSGS